MYPILLDGYLNAERLKTAWREIDYAHAQERAGPSSIVVVVNSPRGEMEAVLETVVRLQEGGLDFTAKIYRAESAAAFIALSARERDIVQNGIFRLDLGGAYVPSNVLVTAEKVSGKIVGEAKRWRAMVFALLEKRGFPKTGNLMTKLLARNELSLTPEECLEFGLVGRII